MTDRALEQSQPKRHHHFRSTRSTDVANVENVIRFPTEPIAEVLSDLLLCGSIVSADEQIVIARNSGWLDHDVAIHGIECFDDPRLREISLDSFAKGIGVAKPQDRRSVLVLLKRIRDIDQDFVVQGLLSNRLQCFHRMHAPGATDDDFAKYRGIAKGSSVRTFA